MRSLKEVLKILRQYGSLEMIEATKDLKVIPSKIIYQKEFEFVKLPSLNNKKIMRVLITGDKGFIGTHLKKYLLKRKYIIKGFDLKRKEKFRHLWQDPNDRFTRLENQDIREYGKVLQSMTEFKPNIVIHLAALAGVRDSIEGYPDYYSTNITGTHNVIKASIENNVKNVLVASSSSIYGNNKEQPIIEEAKYNPLSPYGVSKVGTEMVAKMFAKQIPINIFRPFTVYGENGRPEMVIPRLIHCAKTGEVFERYGDGNTFRGYTNVHDLVNGIEKLMHYLPRNKEGYDVFNLGGQEEIRLNDLIDLVNRNYPVDINVKQVPQPKADPDRNIADISTARCILNWDLKRNFKDEIIKLCK